MGLLSKDWVKSLLFTLAIHKVYASTYTYRRNVENKFGKILSFGKYGINNGNTCMPDI